MAKKKTQPQHVLPVNDILRRLYDFGYFGAKIEIGRAHV